MSEDAAALAVGQLGRAGTARRGSAGRPADPPAAGAVAVGVHDAVVPRQRLIEEGEVGVDQVEDAPVLAQDRLEKQLRLPKHGLA